MTTPDGNAKNRLPRPPPTQAFNPDVRVQHYFTRSSPKIASTPVGRVHHRRQRPPPTATPTLYGRAQPLRVRLPQTGTPTHFGLSHSWRASAKSFSVGSFSLFRFPQGYLCPLLATPRTRKEARAGLMVCLVSFFFVGTSMWFHVPRSCC